MSANRTILLVSLLSLAGGASARGVDVTALAERTGLTERQVRMALGAPSAFAEYRTSLWIAERRVMAALSDPDYCYEDGAAPRVHEVEYAPPAARHAAPPHDAAHAAHHGPPVVRDAREDDGDADDQDEDEGATTEPLHDRASEQQLRVEDVDGDG